MGTCSKHSESENTFFLRPMLRNIDLICDLDTDLAVAFLVEKRFEDSLGSNEAVALIERVKSLLEGIAEAPRGRKEENIQSFAAR